MLVLEGEMESCLRIARKVRKHGFSHRFVTKYLLQTVPLLVFQISLESQ